MPEQAEVDRIVTKYFEIRGIPTPGYSVVPFDDLNATIRECRKRFDQGEDAIVITGIKELPHYFATQLRTVSGICANELPNYAVVAYKVTLYPETLHPKRQV